MDSKKAYEVLFMVVTNHQLYLKTEANWFPPKSIKNVEDNLKLDYSD